MALLPAVGTVSYNGYTFNGSIRSSLAGRMVYDSSGRTVTHVVWSVFIDSYIPEATPGASTDTLIDDIRQRLSTPGQSLTISGTGIGTFTINVGSARDVVWGPKPTLLQLTPVGSKACWRVVWQCDVAIPECANASYQRTPMAFNYSVSYMIDADGYTTRTYEGYLEIPMTRENGSRTVPDTALAYRNRINVPIPAGFRRTQRTFKLSEDRRRLDFTITDEEQPVGSLPVGMTNATGRFSLQSQSSPLISYVVTLSATYTVAPTTPKGRAAALDAFYALLADRVGLARQNYGRLGVIMASFSCDEGLYRDGRTVSFAASWIITNGDVTDILQKSGVWRPVPGTDWRQWAASVAGSQQLGGNANLTETSGEVIMDLCGGSVSIRTPPPPEPPRPPGDRPPKGPELRSGGYLDYKNEIRVEMDSGVITLRSLPTTKPPAPNFNPTLKAGPSALPPGVTVPNNVSLTEGGKPLAPDEVLAQIHKNQLAGVPSFEGLFPAGTVKTGNINNVPAGPSSQGKLINQQRVPPSYKVRMLGYAVTVGIIVPCPSLQSFAGFPVVPTGNQVFDSQTIGQLNGLPVFRFVWNLLYQVAA